MANSVTLQIPELLSPSEPIGSYAPRLGQALQASLARLPQQVPSGMVAEFALASPPEGWVLAGSTIQVDAYPALSQGLGAIPQPGGGSGVVLVPAQTPKYTGTIVCVKT